MELLNIQMLLKLKYYQLNMNCFKIIQTLLIQKQILDFLYQKMLK